jgi:hypothetical protein
MQPLLQPSRPMDVSGGNEIDRAHHAADVLRDQMTALSSMLREKDLLLKAAAERAQTAYKQESEARARLAQAQVDEQARSQVLATQATTQAKAIDEAQSDLAKATTAAKAANARADELSSRQKGLVIERDDLQSRYTAAVRDYWAVVQELALLKSVQESAATNAQKADEFRRQIDLKCQQQLAAYKATDAGQMRELLFTVAPTPPSFEDPRNKSLYSLETVRQDQKQLYQATRYLRQRVLHQSRTGATLKKDLDNVPESADSIDQLIHKAEYWRARIQNGDDRCKDPDSGYRVRQLLDAINLLNTVRAQGLALTVQWSDIGSAITLALDNDQPEAIRESAGRYARSLYDKQRYSVGLKLESLNAPEAKTASPAAPRTFSLGLCELSSSLDAFRKDPTSFVSCIKSQLSPYGSAVTMAVQTLGVALEKRALPNSALLSAEAKSASEGVIKTIGTLVGNTEALLGRVNTMLDAVLKLDNLDQNPANTIPKSGGNSIRRNSIIPGLQPRVPPITACWRRLRVRLRR